MLPRERIRHGFPCVPSSCPPVRFGRVPRPGLDRRDPPPRPAGRRPTDPLRPTGPAGAAPAVAFPDDPRRACSRHLPADAEQLCRRFRGGAVDLFVCRATAADRIGGSGSADGRLGQAGARPILRPPDGDGAPGDAPGCRGGRDLPQHDQGWLHLRRQLRQGGALCPQPRPQLEPAGDGDDGRRERRLPGRRPGG